MIGEKSGIDPSYLSAELIQETSDLIIQETCHLNSGLISEFYQMFLKLNILPHKTCNLKANVKGYESLVPVPDVISLC